MSGARARDGLGAAILRTQPDSRLVSLAREGSDAAIEEIVRRYRASLVAFAAGIVPSHRAEDVVQESLVRAADNLAGRTEDVALRPWLYTIVRNRALNDLRDHRDHEHLDENYDGVPQPPDVAARREELAALVADLQALPDAQREAIVQRELEGRTHEEIADALGTTPGSVRGLIFRARSALRDAAAVLVPIPLLRLLLAGGSGGTAAAAGGAGGGGIAAKAGAAVAVGVLAVGSGVALRGEKLSDPVTPEAIAEPQPFPEGAGIGEVRDPVIGLDSGDEGSGGGSGNSGEGSTSSGEGSTSSGEGSSGSDDGDPSGSSGSSGSGSSGSSGSDDSSGSGEGSGSEDDSTSSGEGSGGDDREESSGPG